MSAASIAALPFREIWAVDFESSAPPGERQEPACLIAWELRSGKKIRLWRDQFGGGSMSIIIGGSLVACGYGLFVVFQVFRGG
jgi:hypothetical protein